MFTRRRKNGSGQPKDVQERPQVLVDPTRGPVGIYPDFCRHEDVVRLHFKPKSSSWSGLDVSVTYVNDDASNTDAMEGAAAEPEIAFLVAGRKLVTATISAPDGTLLYACRQKWASWKNHVYAKNVEGKVIVNVRSEKALKMNLAATFTNAASGSDEERRFVLTTGFSQTWSELHEGDSLLATIERPDLKMKAWNVSEPYRVVIAPKVDISLVVAVCLAMHSQLAAQKLSLLSTPGGAAVALAL